MKVRQGVRVRQMPLPGTLRTQASASHPLWAGSTARSSQEEATWRVRARAGHWRSPPWPDTGELVAAAAVPPRRAAPLVYQTRLFWQSGRPGAPGRAPAPPWAESPRSSLASTVCPGRFVEDVPAFVELESGGPPPVACQVVGVGQPPSHPTKEGDRREQHLSEGPPPCAA